LSYSSEIPPFHMRILYFTRDYTSHDYRFLTALAKTEHKVYYLRLERGEHSHEDRSLPPEIEIVAWKGGRAPARLQDGARLLLDLRRIIHRVKPDLIHAGPLQRSAFLAALTGFQPLVSMSWGYDLLQDADRNAMWRWATRYTLKRSASMVGDCATIRRLAVSYGMPDERIVTFPWGVDLDHFSPKRPEHSNESAFTLLSTRNWEPIYGVEVIAQAFTQAAQQRSELRLVMLGNGSQAGRLHQILSSRNTSNHPQSSVNISRVLLPGLVNYDKLPNFYRSANLYVAATHSDGTSISLLEAMACGCPVLVSDIPGNREWVTPGVNGWLFPDGDTRAMAEAILTAVDQRTRLPKMGHAARKLVEERANWEKNFPELLRAYEIAEKMTSGRTG
jgi:glycosyltransferase involved in cell wall biosynthesis